MSGPHGDPFTKRPLSDLLFVFEMEEHFQLHHLEPLSSQKVLDNTTTTDLNEHDGPWIVIDTTLSDVNSNRSGSWLHEESLSGCHLDAQLDFEPCQPIEAGFASSDMVPDGLKSLVRYCCRVGFLQLVESVRREDPHCQDASKGKTGAHAFKLAMAWMVKESAEFEFKELNEYLQTRNDKACADIATCAVRRALAESEEHADHSNCTNEKVLAFEDVLIAILIGGTDEAGVDDVRSVLAMRGRSLDGGPLRA